MKKKILIADDNANIRLLVNQFLQPEYDVTSFENGADLLNWLELGNTSDLIISDIKMPTINGWDLLNNLKMSLYFKHIPVLVLSGIEKSNEKIKFLEAGAEDYIIKPFSPQELKTRITNIFKRNSYENIN